MKKVMIVCAMVVAGLMGSLNVNAQDVVTAADAAQMSAKELKKAAKVQKGSGQPNRTKVASITWDQVRTIAEGKMPDLNAFTLASAMRMVAGTARSMGIKVTGEFPENL